MFRVFVYGTLKRGFSNHNRIFSEYKIKVTEAWTYGELYDLDWGFPAMVVDLNNNSNDPDSDKVSGELIEINDPELLTTLDWLEGFKSPGNRFNLYDRVKRDVYVQNEKFNSWVYVINPNQITSIPLRKISTGIWV